MHVANRISFQSVLDRETINVLLRLFIIIIHLVANKYQRLYEIPSSYPVSLSLEWGGRSVHQNDNLRQLTQNYDVTNWTKNLCCSAHTSIAVCWQFGIRTQ